MEQYWPVRRWEAQSRGRHCERPRAMRLGARRWFAWGVGLLCTLWLLGAGAVQAQQIQISYGQPCDTVGSCAFGLVCSLTEGGTPGFCVPQCPYPANAQQFEPNSPQCPRREPCRRPAFERFAGCFCLKNEECPAGLECRNHQCAAPAVSEVKVGEICGENKVCGRGLLCTNAVYANEFRCFPYCQQTCNGAGVCVNAPKVVGHNQQSASFSVCVCRENPDCTTGICFGNVCREIPKLGEPCSTTSGCSDDLICYFEKRGQPYGRCHPRCLKNSTCLAGEACISGACVCSDNAPCKLGGTCKEGVCTEISRCSQDSDCNSKRCFKPVSGEIRQGICVQACNSAADCPNQTPCSQLFGSGRACFCTRDSDCPDNRACQDYRCGEIKPPPRQPPSRPSPPPCNPPCQYPFLCRGSVCVKRDIGELCKQALECKSGVCFGPSEPNALKVCSEIVSDCAKCENYRMKCATFDGVQACYRPDDLGVSVFPPAPDRGCAGCQSHEHLPPWGLIPFLLMWIMLRRLRHEAN